MVLTGFLPVAVLAASGYGAYQLVRTAPKAKHRAPTRSAVLVEVEPAARTTETVVVHAMGSVMAAQEIELQARVGGEVMSLGDSMTLGGLVRTGDVLLQIDPSDYQLAIEQSRSQVATAQYEIKLEQGYQDVAKREWDLLGSGASASDRDLDLALRKPHLAKATASLAAAQATLTQAELNLDRARVRAPFNGVITAKRIDVGAMVSPLTLLATLVGTDTYWVRASVPVDRLKWIRTGGRNGQGGSHVRVWQDLGGGAVAEWTGRVVRLLGDLEPQGRMAQVLVAVDDPLGLGAGDGGDRAPGTPLLIAAYVHVDIEGVELRDVVVVSRKHLRDADHVWIQQDNNALDIRPVRVAYRGADHVLLSGGVAPGERVVVTDLSAPVAGMGLRTLEANGADPVARDEQADSTGEGAN